MLTYMMLISPACLESLVQADIQYANLDISAWGQDDTTIEYGYDDNGSMTSKVSKESGVEFERTIYEYNLQNRLALIKVSTDGGTTWDSITGYKYDQDGNQTLN